MTMTIPRFASPIPFQAQLEFRALQSELETKPDGLLLTDKQGQNHLVTKVFTNKEGDYHLVKGTRLDGSPFVEWTGLFGMWMGWVTKEWVDEQQSKTGFVD